MDLFQSIRRKPKKTKETVGSSLTPARSAAPSPIQASTSITALYEVKQDPKVQYCRPITKETPTTQSANDEQFQGIAQQTARESRGRWLARVTFMLSLTKSVADAAGFAPLKGACEAVAVEDNKSAWGDLKKTVQEHKAAFQAQLDQLGINDILEEYEESIKVPIQDYSTILETLLVDIGLASGLDESKFDKSLTLNQFAQHIGTTKLDADTIAGYEKRLRDAEWRIMFSLIVYVTVSVNASADADVLSNLRGKEHVHPRECQTGTRTEILEECMAWTRDPNAPNILWIKAAPGAGKSAIASSLVRSLSIKKKRLGSSFFFYRQDSAINTTRVLWRKVAYDMARHPTIRKHLAAKLRKEEIDLTTPRIDEFFHQLIAEPLLKIGHIPSDQFPVVIVDALDECGGLEGVNSEERRDLMFTLTLWSKLPNCKLIVTSREEDDIARTFALNPPYTIDLLAGGKKADQTKRDIQAFLAEELRSIVSRYSLSSVEWPGVEIIESLATKANGLFIWASTVVQYVRRGNPKKLLEEILHGDNVAGMGSLYTTVLRAAFPDARNDLLQEMRTILSTIIVSRETLDVQIIVNLLSIDLWTVEHICTALRPVLETDGGVRFRHQSFVDFLLNSDTTYLQPRITISDSHRIIANQCLRVMKERLKFNICEISSSHLLNSEVLKSIASLDAYIPSHLQYASRYWAYHLYNGPSNRDAVSLVQDFLQRQFLFWLEVTSLCGFVHEVPSILFPLATWLKANNGDDLVALAADTLRFTTHFDTTISLSAPHIYVSALPLSPPSSEIKEQYWSQFPNSLTVCAGGYQRWSPLLLTLHGHIREVRSVAFSLEGGRIASGSYDQTVRIWDVETGKQIGVPLEGHTNWINSVAFSPNGRRLVSGSDDKTVRVWDVETGKQIIGPLLEGHSKGVNSVAFSPDGSRIVSASWDQTVRVWDAQTGEQMGRTLVGHTDQVNSVAFSPDGQRIISGSSDQTVRVWNTETGEEIGPPFRGHKGQVKSVAFSPDGRYVVSASSDETLRVWNTETGELIGRPLEGHTSTIFSVAFSPDGRRVASGSADQTMRVWDAETGEQIGHPLEGHTSTVFSVAFSPDGRWIISGSADRNVRVWDAKIGEQMERLPKGHPSTVHSVAFLPDGSRILSGVADNTVEIWDAETSEQGGQPLKGHTGSVTSVALSPDGRRIVSGSSDQTVRVWDAETGEQIGAPLKGHTDQVKSVVFSPDGRRIASGSCDETVRVWDIETGEQLGKALHEHKDWVNSVSFSPDGRHIASGSSDYTVRVWDPERGEQIGQPLEGHRSWVRSVSFSPNGRHIISGSDDWTVRVWDAAETGKQIGRELRGHTNWVNSVAFSPDGRRIVSGSNDHTVRVWDAETGEQIGRPFRGHTDWVNSVSFSPDGCRIASGSKDRTVRVWDVANEASTSTLPNLHCEIRDGWLFGPDDERLFWVPPQFCTGLERFGVRILGRCERTTIKASHMTYGERWTEVRNGGGISEGL